MPCCLSSLLCQRVVLKAPQPAAAGGLAIHRDARVLWQSLRPLPDSVGN